MNQIIKKIGFNIIDLFTKNTQKYFRFYKKTEKWTLKQLEEYQLKQLKKLGKHFNLNINSWNDFYNLPLTTKEDLRKWKPDLKYKKYTYHISSGSTGEPLKTYGNHYLQYMKYAIFKRAWTWVGWDKKKEILRLTAGTPQWKWYDWWNNIIPFNYRTINNKAINYVIKKQPFIIHGGCGSIKEITTKVFNKNKQTVLQNINLYLMSEDTRLHKEELKKDYKNIYSGYGLAELCTVASECKYHSMHVNMETCIVERINGEIVVTDLFNYITPVIRYRTKDYGYLKNSVCKCGLQHDILYNIEGRGVDYYVGPETKKPFSWWILSPLVHKYYKIINQWKTEIVPKEKQFVLHVVWKDKPNELKWYRNFVKQKTGFDLKIVTYKKMNNRSRMQLMEVRK